MEWYDGGIKGCSAVRLLWYGGIVHLRGEGLLVEIPVEMFGIQSKAFMVLLSSARKIKSTSYRNH